MKKYLIEIFKIFFFSSFIGIILICALFNGLWAYAYFKEKQDIKLLVDNKDDFQKIIELYNYQEHGCNIDSNNCDYYGRIDFENHNKIDKSNELTQLLSKYEIYSISSNGASCIGVQNCVELSRICGWFNPCGYTYAPNKDNLDTNFDILYTEKIEENWFYFERDWN